MAVRIRLYKPSDKKALADLLAHLQDYVARIDFHKTLRLKDDFDSKAYVQFILGVKRRNKGVIYVVEDKSRIVGYIYGIIVFVDDLEHYNSKEGRIVELFVDSAYRGQKIGEILMEKMEEYFRKSGCDYLRLECLTTNRKAHKFYKKHGYRDSMVVMMKTVSK